MRIRLSDAADNDYASHYLHGLEQFGYVQTERYFEDLRKTFQRLASLPEIGRIRTEFHPPVRIHIFRSHLIFFDIVDDGVLIQRIRQHNEDWQND